MDCQPAPLHQVGPQRTFSGPQLSEIAFPLGGIGTGTISLGGRGHLRDFEIFQHPAKGNSLPFTFFALWACPQGGEPTAKILEGQVPPPYRSGFGEPQQQLLGVSRCCQCSFRGEYPTATVSLADPALPVQATLTAWNPFLPLNVHDSALPVAIFEWTLANPLPQPVEVSLAASISNPLCRLLEGKPTSAGALNEFRAAGPLQGLLLSHPEADPAASGTGTLALVTPWPHLQVQTHWYRGGWWDRCHLFWDRFAAQGDLDQAQQADPAPAGGDVGSLALRATVPAGGSVTLPILLTWHFPRLANPWRADPEDAYAVLDSYVGAHFADAWAVAEYVASHLARLRRDTGHWQQTIFGSTLPTLVLEAVTSQASIMRSPTCFLLADGSFYGWEGCHDQAGCCPGSCTHVWNYEQAVAFLFPQLERTMRRTEFLHNTGPTGHMSFRTFLPPGSRLADFKPCADGQMGTLIQLYRDWQLSGDDAFLQELWPQARLALEYAWTMTPERMDPGSGPGGRSIDSLWDADRDGVMEGEQHNTYDIEFFGPNPLCTIIYLGALRAAEKIARHLGERERAQQYLALYQQGRAQVDAKLYNGEYYFQQVLLAPGVTVPPQLQSPPQAGDPLPKYQHGEGCLADQLLGQWAAQVAGLGHLLDPAHVRQALKAIFTHNFRSPIGSFSNVQRVYALGDEAGLLLCTWPRGGRPALPFPYCDEVWTGFEYQVAAHLIYEGWVEEGLRLVEAVAGRYSGHNRNPYNQVECGHHYARAMSSWSVKLALDGFTFSLPEGRLGFAPRLHAQDFRTFWSTGTGWGQYAQRPGEGWCRLQVIQGEQALRRLDLPHLPAGQVAVQGPQGPLSAHREGPAVVFAAPVRLQAGEALEIKVE